MDNVTEKEYKCSMESYDDLINHIKNWLPENGFKYQMSPDETLFQIRDKVNGTIINIGFEPPFDETEKYSLYVQLGLGLGWRNNPKELENHEIIFPSLKYKHPNEIKEYFFKKSIEILQEIELFLRDKE